MKNNTFDIISGTLDFRIICNDSGAEISKFGKVTIDQDCRTPVFNLTLRDPEKRQDVELSSVEGWDTVSAERLENGANFSFISDAYNLTVKLAVRCEEADNAAVWTAGIINNSAGYGVVSIEYPGLYFGTDQNTCLFHPHGSGALIRDWIGKEADPKDQYPATAACMQYMSVTDESMGVSLYYGVHDPNASYKIISYSKEKDSPVLKLYARFFCENAGKPGNSQTLPGRLVFRAFKGDWYDAAMIYSEFVKNEAVWLPASDNGIRTDTPEWLRNTSHWWMTSVGNDEEYAENILRAQKELGCTSSLHIYSWHEIPFDNDYPHYFPAKKCFLDSFRKLQEAGVRVMPYINGRLWDTRDRKTEDYQFSSVAKNGTAKDDINEPVIECYGSKEEDGSPVRFAVMCPSAPLWASKQREIIDRLFNRIGVDAVYVDQIASAPPVLCYDETHVHPTGGGSWWVKSYHELLSQAREIMPEDTAFTTESTAEPFINLIQGYLSWDSVFDSQVPAFTAVYGGYVLVFGRCYSMTDEDVLFAVAAQSLLWGEQLGWIDPARYLSLNNRRFYNDIVMTRESIRDYFVYGKLLRPPYVKSGAEPVSGNTMRGTFCSEAVLCGIWQNRTSGQKALIIVNISHREETCEITSEYITHVPDFNIPLEGTFKDDRLSLKITAQTVIYAMLD